MVPSLGDRERSSQGRSGKDGRERSHSRFAFLRHSHIFASTVREVFQVKPLRESAPHPLTLSQLGLLRLICVNGRHPVGQVADLLGVSAPAATKAIDRLERLGLVMRRRSQGDRRTTLLLVSRAGREQVQRFEELKEARLSAALDGFETDEVATFARLLSRFSVSMLRSEPAGNGPCLRCATYVEAGCPVGRVRGGCPYERFRGARPGRAAKGASR